MSRSIHKGTREERLQRVAARRHSLRPAMQSGHAPTAPPRDRAAATIPRRGSGRSLALTLGEADAVPLGLSVAGVVHRLGPPARGLQHRDGYECMFYGMVSRPQSDMFQFCFRSGRLVVIASAIG